MALFIFVAFVFAAGMVAGWRFGWNAACAMYRDRTIEKAEQLYEQDKR